MPPGAEGQGIAGVDVMHVIGHVQRAGMFWHVRHRLAGVVRIVEHLSVGIAVAGDDAQVVSERPGDVHLHAPRAHLARRFGNGFIPDRFVVQHVALIDIEQGDIGGHAAEQLELGAQLIGGGLFRRQVADIAGDGRLRHKRLRHVTEQRDGRRQLIDQAKFRRPLLVAAVGIDVKRASLSGILGVILVAHAGDGDPAVVQVERILHVGGVALLLDALIAVGGRHAGAFIDGTVDRVVDIESLHVFTADHAGAQQIVVLVGDTAEDLVVEAANHHVALQIGAGRVHLLG